MASLDSLIDGSGTVSTRTSRLPCQTTAFITETATLDPKTANDPDQVGRCNVMDHDESVEQHGTEPHGQAAEFVDTPHNQPGEQDDASAAPAVDDTADRS